MDPDSDNPVSRIERTFWTVWYYITGAVSRVLGSEPTNVVSSDPNSFQESAADSEAADNGHTQGDISRGKIDEEQPLSAASLLSSSGAVVAWELCKTKNSDLKEDEECTEQKTQLSGVSESKASEEGESTREGRFSETENDDAGLLSPKDTRAEKAEEEENVHQKVDTHRQVESLENVEYEEKLKTGSLAPIDDGMSEITEEDTQRTMTPDDPKKINETIKLGQEGNKIHPEDEEVLEEGDDIEITDSGLEEEDNMHMNEAEVQREDTATSATALMHEKVESSSGVLQLVSECENKSDEGEKPESEISICELWSVGDTGVKLDTGKEKMMAPDSESDINEDEQEEEDDSLLNETEQCEEENMSEAENKQTIYIEPEEEEEIISVREDSQEKNILTKCDACSIDNLQNAEPQSKVSEELVSTREGRFSQTENDDAELLSPKDTRAEKAEEEENVHQKVDTHRQVESLENVEYEEKLKTGSLTPIDDGMSEITEEDTQRTMTPDDPKKMDETVKLGEEGNKIHPEDEQVLEEGDDIEITDSGLEEEDNMHVNEAEVQREDTATSATALMHEKVESSSGVLQLVSECENKSDEGEKPESEISICELWSVSDTGVILDTGKEKMMAPESESDIAEDEQEEEDESMLHERGQYEEENVCEAEKQQTISKEPEEEEEITSVREDSQEKNILTKCDACSIDNLQNAEPQTKVSEELVSTSQGQFSETENDDAGLLSPKDTRAEKAEEEENVHQKVDTHRQVESLENVEYEEKLKTGSLTPIDDGMSEITEEDTQRTMTPDDPKKMDETVKLGEEGNKIHPEDEQVLDEGDEIEIKLCTITDSGLEEEDNMHVNETEVQREDTATLATALMHEKVESSSGVLQLVSECENKSDEGEKPETQISICELWSVGDTGVKQDTGKKNMMAPEREIDSAEDEQEEEDDSLLNESEQCEEGNMSEAENKQTIYKEPEEEDEIMSVREDSQEKNILTKCDACSIDNLQNAEPQCKVSEDLVSTSQGQFSQTENDDTELFSPKDTRAEKAEEEEIVHQKVDTHRQVESLENVEYEEKLKTGSLTPIDDGMSEITEEDTQRTMTPDDPKKMDETVKLGEEGNKIHPEDEQVLEEGDDIEITDSGLEEEDNMHMNEAEVQREDTATSATALMHEKVESSSGVLQLVSECENKSDEGEKPESEISICELWSVGDTGVKLDTGKEKMMAPESESDITEDEQEEEDDSLLNESEQCEEGNMSEVENKQTLYKEPEEEEEIMSVREDSQEKNILTKCDACSIDNLQNAEPDLHTTEFTNEEEEEDVAMNSEMQSKTRETDDVAAAVDEKLYVTTAEVSVNETFFDEDHVEEERPFVETACTHISSTLEPEAETEPEVSGEFKNISLRMCEGEVVVSEELNSATCGETQKGVPEYKNETGQDKNSTQRFLEVVNFKEIQTNQLPEEESSQDSESLQNTGHNYSLVDEHKIKEQESTEDNKQDHTGILYHTHSRLLQETDTPLFDQVNEESGVLFEEEEGKFLVPSMKIEHSQKESGTCVGLTDESDETTIQQQDGTGLDEFETDEGFSDLKDFLGHGSETTGAVAAGEAIQFPEESSKGIGIEEQKMADTSFFQESVDTINLDQHCTMATSLLEDMIESRLLKQSIESKPKTTEDCTVDVHSAVIDSKEMGYGLEEEAAGNEIQNNNQMEMSNLQLVSQLEVKDKNESALFAGSEVDKLFDISNKETVTDTEAADESMTDEFKQKDAAVISPEEMVTDSEWNCAKEESSSISRNQDVIEEEILDLWMQAASSENTADMKHRERPQQIDVKLERSNEEQPEISSVQTETEKEQLVKSNSGESGLVSNTEFSSLTAESGFLNQPVCVWDTQNSATQLLKPAATESFQDIYDTLDSTSESTDISDFSTQQFKFQSQDILIEEAVGTEQSHLKEEESHTETGFHPDSVAMSSEARQDKFDGERVELVETEIEKDTEAETTDPASKNDWKDIEDSDFTSSKKEVEETNFGDEALGVTASHSPSEFKPIQSRQSKSLLEDSEERILSMESGLQVDTWTESERLFQLPSFKKPQPEWSKDSAESLHEQNRTQVADQVDSSALDFTAQRSRIAVKNPRVRPPKDARSLLHMPSVEPTPSSNLPVKVPAGLPLGGLGIGIKLPGLGAGFPVLKKTQRVGREENSSETPKQETKPDDKSDTPKQDEVQHKPKWMPPKQLGFGNPLMSELKTKLKKPTKE
ncbi:hypothetical protein EXN66_Car020154 [Channa argus]|uniref:Uncharacterized protein n=1 Tax=Channa argus TaxID=215402 RepID=A0A6G1QPJ0_CHAAH|nr:hypothetical protein EXN66_Car020154 [Channa argus]